jgi:hypothetical protein
LPTDVVRWNRFRARKSRSEPLEGSAFLTCQPTGTWANRKPNVDLEGGDTWILPSTSTFFPHDELPNPHPRQNEGSSEIADVTSDEALTRCTESVFRIGFLAVGLIPRSSSYLCCRGLGSRRFAYYPHNIVQAHFPKSIRKVEDCSASWQKLPGAWSYIPPFPLNGSTLDH